MKTSLRRYAQEKRHPFSFFCTYTKSGSQYGRESESPLIENRILYYAAAGLEIFERIDNF